MNGLFEKRLRGVVVAAWWTVVIWWAILAVSWGAYLLFMFTRPNWLLLFWGGGEGLDWDCVQFIWLFFAVTLKLLLLVFLMVTICLTLWLRQLKRAS